MACPPQPNLALEAMARARSFALLLAFLLAFPSSVRAQSIDPNLWVTNGVVSAVAVSGNTLYIGGSFSQVGPASGGGAPINASSGSLLSGFPPVNGYVNAAISDGSGGWFIGGHFSQVGGLPRAGLAHILSDQTVSPWNPGISAPGGGQVLALALSGSTVYAAGFFTQAGGQPRNYLAAINATTGMATAWNPSPNDVVYALMVNGSRVFIGGNFSMIGGAPRLHLAGIEGDGTILGWTPDPDGSVTALALSASGSTIYAGGSFGTAGGQPRSNLAEISLTTGTATSWNPSVNGSVGALAVNGGNVYVGGGFTSAGGQFRLNLAAIDALSGAVTSWNPAPSGNLRAIAVSGGLVYVGGGFDLIDGTGRNFLAAIDATTGTITPWNPNPNATVSTLAVSGSVVYAGGDFTSFGGSVRNNLAALKLTTGAVYPWNPDVDGPVQCIAVSGGKVYIGGSFDKVGASTRNNLAEIDASSGLATSFNVVVDGSVMAVGVSGSTVYLGGAFANVNGNSRSNLAAVKTLNGILRSWNPGANGFVFSLLVNGTTIYAGGGFTSAGGAGRNFIAAIDSTSGTATSWNPNGNASVRTLALGTNGYLYAGGDFTNIGSMQRNRLAALSVSTGVASVWDPNVDGTVFSLGAAGTALYVGGNFSTIAAASRTNAAAITLAPSPPSALPWSAPATWDVLALAVADSSVYLGGSFLGVGPTAQARIARVSAIPEVSSIYQPFGGNAGITSVTVNGNAFRAGATVKLKRPPDPDIVAAPVAVASGGGSLTASFDLTGATTGIWNLVVTNPDGLSSVNTLSTFFSIQGEAAPQLEVSIVGPDSIRANYLTAFDLVVENPGNVDAVSVPLWVTGIPGAVTVIPDFTLSPPPQAGGEPNWSAVPVAFQAASGQYLPVVIPRVPPGTLRRRFILSAPSNVSLVQMGAAVTPSWSAPGAFLSCLASGGVIGNQTCAGGQLAAIDAYLAANPGLEGMSGTGIWAKEAFQCEGTPDLNTSITHAKQVLDLLEGAVENGTLPAAGCGDAMLAQWRQVLNIHVVFAIDPNDKLAPQGTVSSLQSIPYSIRFENQASSSVAARQVTLVDPLPTALDLSTLSLDAIDLFGSVHLLPPPGSKQYTHDVDLGHDNLMVRVSANLDFPSRQLTWLFSTLDKTTLQPPGNPLLGFLPPNQTPPQGEGSVLFTIKASASAPNGSIIQNGAVINFDGSSQNTPVVANQIDTNAPASSVNSLNTPISTSSFPVSWTASGSPNDLKDFTIYVSEDGAPYSAWKVNTISTTDTYVPHPGGHNYYFYSVARDLSGNIEPPPPGPDAQTLSTTAVETSAFGRLALAGARPNPARDGVLRVVFTLTSRERATLELIDVAGRRVARRDVGELGPGPHELAFDKPRLKAGLYFLRLIQGAEVLNARAVMMR